jgi:peptide/nickel transport system substrate-binding protein
VRASQTRSLFFLVLVAGVVAITLFWSLASKTDDEVINPDFGGAYIEGIAGSPARVNPLFARENATDETLASLVFAGLTRLNEHGSPFPDMAETWSLSPDGLTYVFTLRPGLLWHDGVPVTAADVVFTYELLQAPELPIPPKLAGLLVGASITAPDARTVAITLSRPYSPLPAYLTLGIVPRHSLDGLSISEIYNSFFNQQPIGSGPYRLVQLTPSEAELVANPAYHLDQPFIQRMELRFYRDDGGVYAALERREIQAALFPGGVGEADLLDLELKRDLRLTPLDTGEITYVYFNLGLPMFQDRRVRQALLYALDRDALIFDALDGQAARAESPIPPTSWAYSPSLTRYETDAKLAGLLLDEAGWLREADGVRRKDGAPLSFTLTTNPDPVRVAVAEATASSWNAIGLQVNVSTIGVSELVRNRLEPRDYEATIWARIAGADPDPYEQWHSSQATGESANLTSFSDPRVDVILEQARTVSQPRRKELYFEFQELFAQEVPAIPLYVSTAAYVQETNLQGVRVALLTEPGNRFWQVQEWYLQTR